MVFYIIFKRKVSLNITNNKQLVFFVLLRNINFLPLQRIFVFTLRETNCSCDKIKKLNLCCIFQGIRARILETLVMLILLALLILGIVWVASALIDNDAASMESLYGAD